MANICITTMSIYGYGENFCRLVDDLDALYASGEKRVENEEWIGRLLEKNGVDTSSMDLRGWICYYDTESANHGFSFSMDVESKWNPPYDWMKKIEELYEGVGISYIAEELGCGIYETNDIELWAGCRFKVLSDDYDAVEFSTREEVDEYLKEKNLTDENSNVYELEIV